MSVNFCRYSRYSGNNSAKTHHIRICTVPWSFKQTFTQQTSFAWGTAGIFWLFCKHRFSIWKPNFSCVTKIRAWEEVSFM